MRINTVSVLQKFQIGKYCHCCGYKLSYYPYGESYDAPNYDICHYCGIEFGNHDMPLLEDLCEYRLDWIEKGAKPWKIHSSTNEFTQSTQLSLLPEELFDTGSKADVLNKLDIVLSNHNKYFKKIKIDFRLILAKAKFGKICHCCGNNLEYYPYGVEYDNPSNDFCYCCGIQYLNQNAFLEDVVKYRTRWIEDGARIIRPGLIKNINLEKQISSLPYIFFTYPDKPQILELLDKAIKGRNS